MFRLFDETTMANLCVLPGEPLCVRLAAQDLLRDIARVSGHAPSFCNEPQANCPTLFIGTLTNASAARWASEAQTAARNVEGRWEHYLLQTLTDGNMAIIGSDERGTMWGIYEFSRRYLRVDPLYLWTDHAPERLDEVILSDICLMDGPQTYRFRGWFINDEDLIVGFCTKGQCGEEKHFQKNYQPMLQRIIETALRLKQNLLIPCSFLDIDDPDDEALVRIVTERGMFISMHHQEPVGVHQRTVDRWWPDEQNVNYVDHPERYEQIWRYYIRKWAKYPHVIWQIGLRGRGDQPVWYANERVPASVEARGALISRAIHKQLEIIRQETAGQEIIATSTLWMEGMPLYKSGALRFPEGTIIVMSDFGPDQMWGEGYETAPRLPGYDYGVYYHLAFWGCGPHLVPGNRLEKIQFNYQAASAKRDTCYSIVNVSNVREFACGIGFLSELTWDIRRADADSYRKRWCAEEYAPQHAAELASILQDYDMCFAEMDSSAFPRQMVLMDGMCKRVGQMLFRILQGGEMVPMAIQNQRLFAFASTDAFIARYEQLTREAGRRFAALLERARLLQGQIPEDRRPYYLDSVIVPAELMEGLYGWVNGLARAAGALREKEQSTLIQAALRDAAAALERAICSRDKAAHDVWRDWYSSDSCMTLHALLEQTQALARQMPER